MPVSTNTPNDWRHSKWLILAELLVVALIFVADAHHLIPFSKTPFLFAFAWLSLLRRSNHCNSQKSDCAWMVGSEIV